MFSFIASPLFKVGAILAVILGIFTSGYLLGNHMADQSARIAELERDSRDLTNQRDTARVERDTANRLMKSANDIALQAAEREQAAQAENDELEGMVREYESSLRKEADRVCGFTATDLDRLRAIYERAFGALHPGTSTSPGMDGSAGKDRVSPTGR